MSEGGPFRGKARPAHVLLSAAIVVVVYGSLFPFDFQSQAAPLQDLLSNWNPFLDRADAVDNILLFMPLGLSLHFAFDGRLARGIASALVWLVLGLGLQLAQLFVPERVASLADAINNALGLVIGLCVARHSASWFQARRLIGSIGDRFALLLVLAWYAFESFPFVPTLDVGLLGQHLKHALQPGPFEASRLARHALAAALGTMLLLRAHPLHARRANVAVAAAVVLLSEMLVPYGGLHIETLIGIVVGLVLGERLDRFFGPRSRWIVMPLALAALTTTVVTPFRAQSLDGGFTLTPFAGLLWFGNTSGIPPAAFETLAIGSLLWSGLDSNPKTGGSLRRWPWVVLAVLVAAEAARVLVLGFRGDTTTLALWLILAPLAQLMRRPAPARPADEPPAPVEIRGAIQASVGAAATRPTIFSPRRRVALHAVVGASILTIGLWLAVQLPTMPYNVKELFASRDLLRIAPFSIALLWLGWGPWWVATTAGRTRAGVLWLPVLLFAASMLSLLLLNVSVSQESIDDIVGSPDLYRRVTTEGLWGTEWSARMSTWPAQPVQVVEQTLRFLALYGLLLIPLTVTAMQLCGRWPTQRNWMGIAVAAGTWWFCKIVVVDWAITDNLTELIARDGVPYLAMVLALLATNVGMLAAKTTSTGLLAAAIVTASFIPTAWWLLLHGLERVLLKYDLVFSALQFLLGQNRSIQLTDWQLFGRWTILYLATVGVLTWGMRLARSCAPPMRTAAGSLRPGAPPAGEVN